MNHTVYHIQYMKSIRIILFQDFKKPCLVLMWLRGLLGVPAENQKLWKHHFQTTAEMDTNFTKERYVYVTYQQKYCEKP